MSKVFASKHFRIFGSMAFITTLISVMVACSPSNPSTGVYPAGVIAPQSCTVGTANCVNGVYTPGAYVHFVGNISQNLNASTARTLVYAAGGQSCYGSACWYASQIDIQTSPTSYAGSTATYAVTLTFAGSMQAISIPVIGNYIATGSGVDIQGISATGLSAKIDVLSTQPLDGTVPVVPSVQINANGQSLATTTLYRVQ